MGPFSGTCFRITTSIAHGSRQMEQRTVQVPFHHLSLNMQCMNQLGRKITSVSIIDGTTSVEAQKEPATAKSSDKARTIKEAKQVTKRSRRKSKSQ